MVCGLFAFCVLFFFREERNRKTPARWLLPEVHYSPIGMNDILEFYIIRSYEGIGGRKQGWAVEARVISLTWLPCFVRFTEMFYNFVDEI